jgi:hypothetical protein
MICRPSDKEFKANVEALTTCMNVGVAVMAACACRPVDRRYFLVVIVSQTHHYKTKYCV